MSRLHIVILISLLAVLGACGQTGPLVLPEDTPASQTDSDEE